MESERIAIGKQARTVIEWTVRTLFNEILSTSKERCGAISGKSIVLVAVFAAKHGF
jgi:hypothetical protein